MKLRGFTSQNFLKKNLAGFTLVELLIVIAIISILISLAAASFLRAQRQGRDSQRKSDLEKVANALEQYYGDNNAYPETEVVTGNGRINCGTGGIDWGLTLTCGGVTYLNELPEDPISTQDYYYEARNVSDASGCSGDACQRFILAADLENNNDPEADDDTCLSTGDDYDYCIPNP